MKNIIIMFRTLTLLVGITVAPLFFMNVVFASQESDIQRLKDIEAINSLVTRYMRIYDTQEPALYLSLFAKNAVVYSMGKKITGDENIRQIVIGLKKQFDQLKEAGTPIWVYHQLSNSEITILNETEAQHQAYWTATVIDAEGKTTTPIIGGYKDKLVKQANGEWLFAQREILSFGPPPKMPKK